MITLEEFKELDELKKYLDTEDFESRIGYIYKNYNNSVYLSYNFKDKSINIDNGSYYEIFKSLFFVELSC